MTKTRPAPKPARPTGGGSFIRDRKTGALIRADGRATAPTAIADPSGEAAGTQSQEG